MKTNNHFHRYLIVAACLLGAPHLIAAEGYTDFYLDLLSIGGAVEVTVNGFPVIENSGPEVGYSGWITPKLQNGENHFEVFYLPDPDSVNRELDVSVVEHPHDMKAREMDSGTRLFERSVKADAEYWLSGLPKEEGRLIQGNIDPEAGRLLFQKGEEGWWTLEFLLTDPITGCPSGLSYVGLSARLEDAELLLTGKTNRARIQWKGLALPDGLQDLTLDPANLDSGHRWMLDPEGRFDTVILRGRNTTAQEVELITLKLKSQTGSFVFKETLQLNLPFTWDWEKAADVRDALANPNLRSSLIAFISELHTVMDTRRPEEWGSFFDIKTRELARAAYRPLEAMEAGQADFFSMLAGTPGWGLEPFNPASLRIYAVNDKVAAVRALDGLGPIVSKPIQKSGSQMKDRFSIPLFVSLIEGEWKIVR